MKILAAHGVRRVGVFGSVARGEDRPGSDIDLVVSVEPGRKRELLVLPEALERVLGVPVDVVDSELLFRNARRTGRGISIIREAVPL
ncbi:MAG: nucleotidyltransferase domain-containing protein [Bifidobacteriaceae bacterium]|nr:nucleotidyltransferase domain-containing protein [Bifidobacteriaceae bacterium]